MRSTNVSNISVSVLLTSGRTRSWPESRCFICSLTRVTAPSRPNPPITARNSSGSLVRDSVCFSPAAVSKSSSSTCSPNAPALKQFLPWMFMATHPPIVGCIVPGTTAGHQPCGSA